MVVNTKDNHRELQHVNETGKKAPQVEPSNSYDEIKIAFFNSSQNWYEYFNSFSPMMNFDFSINRMQEYSNEISRHISDYIMSSKLQKSLSENRQLTINSVKTAIVKRLQMNKFFHDLDIGLSLSVAIDRLQPINDMIQEAIFLPADDSDIEDEENSGNMNSENSTEPVGVDMIVQTDNILISDVVRPPEETINPRNSSRTTKRSRQEYRKDISSSQETDFENMEGLSSNEIRDLTELETLDDFCNENLMRRKIQKIQTLEDVNETAKNKLVTRLMMDNYYKYANEKLLSEDMSLSPKMKKEKLYIPHDPISGESEREIDQVPLEETRQREEEKLDDEEVVLTEEDQAPSYHDYPFNTIMGCPHYQRNCKIECPTCLRWYPCRFCHDSVISSHKLARSDVKHILCMKCNVPQVPDTNYCTNCKEELAEYFCPKCKLYDNDAMKNIYHCDKCGICRLGLGLDKDFFHCDTCNICLSIDLKEKHKCLTNTAHCNCPICNEYLFTSMSKVVFMSCGHLIHQACYDEMIRHSYKCPICKKTVANMDAQFRILDQEITQLPMPSPYSMWKIIITCNDCKGKCIVPYHILGLKCKYCNSFNTNKCKLIKPETEIQDEVDEDGQDEERQASRAMRLIPTNIHSNFNIDVPAEEDFTSDDIGEGSDSENLDCDDEDRQNILSLRRITHSVMSNLPSTTQGLNNLPQSNTTSIVALLQNFVNNSIISKPPES